MNKSSGTIADFNILSFPFGRQLRNISALHVNWYHITKTKQEGFTSRPDFHRYDEGTFDFGVDSPFSVILSTAALLNLCAILVGIFRYNINMVAEMLLTGYGVANSWPIYEAMFLRTDNGKMPDRVKLRAFLLTGIVLAGGFLVFNA